MLQCATCACERAERARCLMPTRVAAASFLPRRCHYCCHAAEAAAAYDAMPLLLLPRSADDAARLRYATTPPCCFSLIFAAMPLDYFIVSALIFCRALIRAIRLFCRV